MPVSLELDLYVPFGGKESSFAIVDFSTRRCVLRGA